MPLSQADRIAFSASIVTGPATIATIQTAKGQLSAVKDKTQALDTANNNLFIPINILVNSYQVEYQNLDGIVRTTIVEQDIQDAARRKLQNHFFPNDTTVSVPSLSAAHNVWINVTPFALTYAIGKNYSEGNATATKEGDLINSILSYIATAGTHQDIENTTGQMAIQGQAAHCSNPAFLNQAACELNGDTWIPLSSDQIISFPAVVTLKNDIVAAVNALKTFVLSEVAAIVTNDKDTARQSQNDVAIAYINSTLLPAIDTWLAYVDFNTAHGQTTYAGFYAYNSNLLAPTKLHSAQLATLTSALNSRLSFITTRLSQLNVDLGSISQDVSNGSITALSGLYGQRYGMLGLRLHILTGSLTALVGQETALAAQDSIIAGIRSNITVYSSVIPTSKLQAPASGTTMVHAVDASLYNPGDSVYIISDTQEELQRAIKSINGSAIVLNDAIPAKYRPLENARIYKDLT